MPRPHRCPMKPRPGGSRNRPQDREPCSVPPGRLRAPTRGAPLGSYVRRPVMTPALPAGACRCARGTPRPPDHGAQWPRGAAFGWCPRPVLPAGVGPTSGRRRRSCGPGLLRGRSHRPPTPRTSCRPGRRRWRESQGGTPETSGWS